jgi:hypothetical protein
MIAAQGACSWLPYLCATYRPRTLQVYTPTPDGFERFLREAVGLPAEMPGEDHGGRGRIPQGDPKRQGGACVITA